MSPIPEFIDGYHLPDGEFECTIEEIKERFLDSQQRRYVWELFMRFIDRLSNFNLLPEYVLINGSFVTGRQSPGDVDFGALIRPEAVQKALDSLVDEHEKNAVNLLLNHENQSAIRDLFGTHFIIAFNEQMMSQISLLFRYGLSGTLRDPDPNKDPGWVIKPESKGILKVNLKPYYNDGGEGND